MSIQSKRAAETKAFAVDFSDLLQDEEELTGTPTVVEVDTAHLTISGKELNDDDFTVDVFPVSANRVVRFVVAGGSAGMTYTIRITVTSDADTAQTLIKDFSLRVN